MADECLRYRSRLAELLSAKKQERYATTISWVRAKVCFAILRSALLCLRGSRTPRRRNLDVKDRDLEIEKGEAGLPWLNSYTYFIDMTYIWNNSFSFFTFVDSCLHLLCWKPPDHQEVLFHYSYTKFVFNFQFEKSLIKYVFFIKNKIGSKLSNVIIVKNHPSEKRSCFFSGNT